MKTTAIMAKEISFWFPNTHHGAQFFLVVDEKGDCLHIYLDHPTQLVALCDQVVAIRAELAEYLDAQPKKATP